MVNRQYGVKDANYGFPIKNHVAALSGIHYSFKNFFPSGIRLQPHLVYKLCRYPAQWIYVKPAFCHVMLLYGGQIPRLAHPLDQTIVSARLIYGPDTWRMTKQCFTY